MKYVSTRGTDEYLTAAEAIIRGIAPDRGLYVPTEYPALASGLEALVGKPYREVARQVIGAFFDDYTEEEIEACVNGAYDSKFDCEEIVPLTEVGGAWFIEL